MSPRPDAPPVLVALDFDLTIYDYRDPPRIMSVQPRLEQLAAAGVRLGIASGRSVTDLRKTLTEAGPVWGQPWPAFVIAYDGEICQPDGSDWPGAHAWNRERRQRVRQVWRQVEPLFRTMVAWAAGRGIGLQQDIMRHDGGLTVAFDDPPAAQRVLDEMQQRLAQMRDVPDVTLSRNHHIVLALPRGMGKGDALQHLTLLEGLTPAQVLAVGDNLNDLSMFAPELGFQIATVANADPRVKAAVTQRGGLIAEQEIAAGVLEIFAVYFPHVLGASARARQRS